MPFDSGGHNLIGDGGDDNKFIHFPLMLSTKSSTLLLIDAIYMVEMRGW